MEFDIFLWFTPLVSVVILFITTFYSLARIGKREILKKKLPPQAAGGWPLIGHLPLLSGPELPHIILSNMADEYGPIFNIRLGVHRALLVSSWEIAKGCFTTNDMIFCDRPKTIAVQHMSYNFAMFGLGKHGPYWRELRKISMQKLLSNHKTETLGNLCENEVRKLMKSLYSSCVKNASGKVQLEMRKLSGDLTLNLMVRKVTGDIDNKRRDEKWGETMTEFFRMMGVLTVPDVLPYLGSFDWFGGISRAF
ncbi:cytochrome [Sesamum alatum]|uniref:Cytochrome n=1 Tax=Sesamum alatum TaxID=300844 RepID=A0AAE2CNS2_9LAMI|nr:cytochrome [Sesamum alatum]